MKKVALAALVSLLVAGCAHDISPQTYRVGGVGQVNQTQPATVVGVREVEVAGNREVGTGAGTAVGAIVGSAAGSGNRGSLIGAIGGAILGGMAGSAIESGATKQRGLEYIVETEGGRLMTIVQGLEPVFYKGQRVLILYGNPTRLIADPRGR
jgi:outer membrane lipoprotein SlyB